MIMSAIYKDIVFVLLVITAGLASCTSTTVIYDSPPGVVDAEGIECYEFPADWLGYWQGDLEIINGRGGRQVVPMALDYRKEKDSDRYHWAIIYGADTIAGRRDYFLEAVNDSIGHYRIDEQNSIVIDAYNYGNALVSGFEVQGNLLTSVSRRDGADMVFEIYMLKAEKGAETGGGIVDSNAVPTVVTYPVAVRQVARLKRR